MEFVKSNGKAVLQLPLSRPPNGSHPPCNRRRCPHLYPHQQHLLHQLHPLLAVPLPCARCLLKPRVTDI